MNASSLRIIVLGYIVRGPLGGLAWHHLQYVMGLARLGHDVYFMEDSDDYPACYDPVTGGMGTDCEYGLRFAASAFGKVGLGDRWAYYDAHTSRWHGPCGARALDICASADVLLNISGVNPIRPWFNQIPVRTLIDTDPTFTQIRHLTDPAARDCALSHTSFLTFGENIGQPKCTIPDDGLPWQSTRQPIVLDAWPVTPAPSLAKFTTVMQWESYPPREYGGVRYGPKSYSFGPYLDLPDRSGQTLELALGSSNAPRELLREKGWALRDPLEVTRDPWTYQTYIQESFAEFSVAKHAYVASYSGWFSERSAAYMASGRPVVAQETGFSEWLVGGQGVLPFSTPDEAVAAVDAVNRDYVLHCRAAREAAQEYFDARRVLPRLIELATNSYPSLSARQNRSE